MQSFNIKGYGKQEGWKLYMIGGKPPGTITFTNWKCFIADFKVGIMKSLLNTFWDAPWQFLLQERRNSKHCFFLQCEISIFWLDDGRLMESITENIFQLQGFHFMVMFYYYFSCRKNCNIRYFENVQWKNQLNSKGAPFSLFLSKPGTYQAEFPLIKNFPVGSCKLAWHLFLDTWQFSPPSFDHLCPDAPS